MKLKYYLFLAIICLALSHIAILILEAIAIVRKGFLGTGLGRAGNRFLFPVEIQNMLLQTLQQHGSQIGQIN